MYQSAKRYRLALWFYVAAGLKLNGNICKCTAQIPAGITTKNYQKKEHPAETAAAHSAHFTSFLHYYINKKVITFLLIYLKILTH